jgi:hypothetical protein
MTYILQYMCFYFSHKQTNYLGCLETYKCFCFEDVGLGNTQHHGNGPGQQNQLLDRGGHFHIQGSTSGQRRHFHIKGSTSGQRRHFHEQGSTSGQRKAIFWLKDSFQARVGPYSDKRINFWPDGGHTYSDRGIHFWSEEGHIQRVVSISGQRWSILRQKVQFLARGEPSHRRINFRIP